jgi:hypothetical protein
VPICPECENFVDRVQSCMECGRQGCLLCLFVTEEDTHCENCWLNEESKREIDRQAT